MAIEAFVIRQNGEYGGTAIAGVAEGEECVEGRSVDEA